MNNCPSYIDHVYYQSKYKLQFHNKKEAYVHYLKVGKQAGYFPNREMETMYYKTMNFDPDYYKRKYLVKGTNTDIKQFWKNHGSKRGDFVNKCEELGDHAPFMCNCKPNNDMHQNECDTGLTFSDNAINTFSSKLKKQVIINTDADSWIMSARDSECNDIPKNKNKDNISDISSSVPSCPNLHENIKNHNDNNSDNELNEAIHNALYSDQSKILSDPITSKCQESTTSYESYNGNPLNNSLVSTSTESSAESSTESSNKKSSVKKASVKKSPDKKASVKKSPDKKVSVKKSPDKKASVKKASVKKTSVKKSSDKKASVKKSSVKKTSVIPNTKNHIQEKQHLASQISIFNNNNNNDHSSDSTCDCSKCAQPKPTTQVIDNNTNYIDSKKATNMKRQMIMKPGIINANINSRKLTQKQSNLTQPDKNHIHLPHRDNDQCIIDNIDCIENDSFLDEIVDDNYVVLTTKNKKNISLPLRTNHIRNSKNVQNSKNVSNKIKIESIDTTDDNYSNNSISDDSESDNSSKSDNDASCVKNEDLNVINQMKYHSDIISELDKLTVCDKLPTNNNHHKTTDVMPNEININRELQQRINRDIHKLKYLHNAESTQNTTDELMNTYMFDQQIETICKNIQNIKDYLGRSCIYLDSYIQILKDAYKCLSDIFNQRNSYISYNMFRIKLCNIMKEADNMTRISLFNNLPIFYYSQSNKKSHSHIKFPLYVCTDKSSNNILEQNFGKNQTYFKVQLIKVSPKHLKLEQYCYPPLSKGEKVSHSTSPIPPCDCPLGNIPNRASRIEKNMMKYWDINYHLKRFESAMYRVTMAKEVLCNYSRTIELKEELTMKIKIVNLKKEQKLDTLSYVDGL
jgi:hypothetical protein